MRGFSGLNFLPGLIAAIMFLLTRHSTQYRSTFNTLAAAVQRSHLRLMMVK